MRLPCSYIGEEVGNGTPPELDVAVDPVDGTRLASLGLPGAIAVVATAERGTMYSAPQVCIIWKRLPLALLPEM